MRKPDGHNTLADVPARLLASIILFLAVLASPAAAARGGLTQEEWDQRVGEAQRGFQRVQQTHAALYSAGPVVELVTMGVGGLIWERHGHIALCVWHGPVKHDCYNYGVGDFQRPLAMASGFFRANKSFWVKKDPWSVMVQPYLWGDRTIWVQPLDLTPEQVRRVVDKLDRDVLPENKHYSYDHLWDNCTTRVRDVLDQATDGELTKLPGTTDGRTFRELAREGFLGREGFGSQWLPLLATDLAMGRNSDQVPTFYERMFLPDYLREATIAWKGVQPIAVYERKGPLAVKELEKKLADGNLSPEDQARYKARLDALHDQSSGRFGFILFILLITAPAWATRLWGRFQRTGLIVALVPPVLLGTVFWFLAIISPLPYVRWNETCLCLMPFDLLLLFGPERRRQLYARGRVAMLGLVGLLLLVGVFKAPVWTAWLWGLVPNAVVAFLPRKQRVEKIAAPVEGAGEVKKSKREAS